VKVIKNSYLHLSKENANENDLLLILLLLGALQTIELDRKTLDYFGDRLFNPYSLDVLNSAPVNPQITNVLHQCLFLEDYESLSFSNESFHKKIQELRATLLTLLKSNITEYSSSTQGLDFVGAKWLDSAEETLF
jgi:Protein of unknown function (DUF3969)